MMRDACICIELHSFFASNSQLVTFVVVVIVTSRTFRFLEMKPRGQQSEKVFFKYQISCESSPRFGLASFIRDESRGFGMAANRETRARRECNLVHDNGETSVPRVSQLA